MSLADLDLHSGSSISKYLKKSFKKYDVEKRKEMSVKEAVAIVEDLYEHTGLDTPAGWDRKLLEALRPLAAGDALTVPAFCTALMGSKFWEGMEKKGNLKAKKAFGEEGRAALADVLEENDGFLEPAELADAYRSLAARLKKAWGTDTLQTVAELQLKKRAKPPDSPIQSDEFLALCLAGPVRHCELKPTWWSKLGKKKGGRDPDGASLTPRSSIRSSGGDPEDVDLKVQPVRLAVHYQDVSLAVAYRAPLGGIRIRRIHLKRHLTPATGCAALAERLVKVHPDVLTVERLVPLLEVLQRHMPKGSSGPGGAEPPAPPPRRASANSDDAEGGGRLGGIALEGDDADFNTIDEEQLKAVKAKMDLEFEKKRIKPGDPNWQYRVDMEV
eukprot:EG_transcript_14797